MADDQIRMQAARLGAGIDEIFHRALQLTGIYLAAGLFLPGKRGALETQIKVLEARANHQLRQLPVNEARIQRVGRVKVDLDFAAQSFFEKRLQNLRRPVEERVVVECRMLDAQAAQKFQFGDGAVERPGVKLRIDLRRRAVGAAKRTAIGKLEHSGLQTRIESPQRQRVLVRRHRQEVPQR